MTLIATFRTNDVPIVIGDLLLSGPERSDVDVSVPSVGKITNVFPAGSGWSIVGLSQKVNIVSDDCVVAWAGTQIYARSVVKELRELATKAPLTLQAIDHYFSELDAATSNEVEIVGWIKDGTNFANFSYPAKDSFDAGLFQEVQAGGMAANTFQPLLRSIPSEFEEAGSNTDPLVSAISTSLMALGAAWQAEQHTQKNLVEYFGGGWEIAAFSNGKFSKVGNITFVIWTANLMPSGLQLRFPKLVIKQDYKEDMLVMRVARLTEQGWAADQECYTVAPVYASVSSEKKQQIKQMRPPDMNSKFTCHYVSTQTATDRKVDVGLLECSTRTIGPYSVCPFTLFLEDEKGLRIVVKPEFGRRLLDVAQRAARR